MTERRFYMSIGGAVVGLFALIAILQFIPRIYIYCGVSILTLAIGSYCAVRIRWHLQRKYHELEDVRIRSREIHKDTIGYYGIDGTPHLFEHMLATQELPAIDRGQVVDSSILPVAPAFKDMPPLPEGTYCLGYGQDGMILGDIEYLLSTLVVGRPGTGKTTGMRYLAAQLLRNHGTPVVLDPHGSLGLGLEYASNKSQYDAVAVKIQSLLEYRLETWESTPHEDRKTMHFPATIIIADEWPVIAEQSPAALAVARHIVLEGRKVGMYALIASQGAPASLFGGSLLRDTMSSRYIYATSHRQARMAGLEVEEKEKGMMRSIEHTRGYCILASARTAPCIVAIPNTTEMDVKVQYHEQTSPLRSNAALLDISSADFTGQESPISQANKPTQSNNKTLDFADDTYSPMMSNGNVQYHEQTSPLLQYEQRVEIAKKHGKTLLDLRTKGALNKQEVVYLLFGVRPGKAVPNYKDYIAELPYIWQALYRLLEDGYRFE